MALGSRCLISYAKQERKNERLKENTGGEEGGREILSIETNGFRGSFRTILTKTLQHKYQLDDNYSSFNSGIETIITIKL